MTGMESVGTAFLDANILVAAVLRDTLLRGAIAGLFTPAWTERILDEVERALVEGNLTTSAGAQRLVATLRRYFPNAIVNAQEHLPFTLPDDADAHVLGSAAACGATMLVTLNTRHFPLHEASQLGVAIVSPDELLLRVLAMSPDVLEQIIRDQAADLVAPPLTPADVLANLGLHAPIFAARMTKQLGQ